MAGTRRISGLHNQIKSDGVPASGKSHLSDRNVTNDLSGPTSTQSHPRPLPPRQIRDSVPSFTGRTAELERLVRMLRATTGAVATISGLRNVGGIGKTELACRAASDLSAVYPLQILVELRGQSEAPLRPELALERIIRLIQGVDTRLPSELEALITIYRMLISSHRALIVADDARDAAQVRPLLPPPGCALLITSRCRLMVQGVPTYHTLDLDVLPNADSAALLRTICSRLSTAQAAELAARSSHLPLALQILGNVQRDDPTRPYPEFLQALISERTRQEATRLTEGGSLEALAAMAIGWRNVDPFSRIALGQLTILNGSFDLETATAVIALSDVASPIPEILRRLQRSYLLEFDAKSGNYRLHEQVRAFAQSQSDAGAEQAAWARLSAHLTQVLQTAEQRYRHGRDGALEALTRFDRDRSHLEAAQARAAERAQHDDVAAASSINLVLASPTLLSQRLPARTRVRWLETALVAARRLSERTSEGRILSYLGLAYRELGQHPRAIDLFEQCLMLTRAIGDRPLEARALSNLGVAYLDLGQAQRAVAYFEPNLVIARELGDRKAEGVALGNLGLANLDLGLAQQAITYFEMDLAIARGLGDHRSEGRALGNLGLAQRLNGQPQRAIEYYEQHLNIARSVVDRRGEANSMWNRALALESLGRRAEAIAGAEAALRIREEIGDPRTEKVRTALTAWKSPSQTTKR